MRAFPKRFRILALLVALGASVSACAQSDLPSDAEVDRWMQGAEQHLPGWSVHFQPAELTYELRYSVTIQAYVDVKKAKLALHDLHVFVRVDGGGGFLDKHRSSIHKIPGTADVSVSESFYAKPGEYRVAFAVYDPANKTHGVWKKSIRVEESHGLVPDYPGAKAVEFIDPKAPFSIGDKPVFSGGENLRPAQIDVLLNLTERKELEMESNGERDGSQQDFATRTILAMAQTLAAIPVNGCVRLSAIDATRAKVYLDRVRSLDAESLLKTMEAHRNVSQVDVRTLTLRKTASNFTKEFLERLMVGAPDCRSPRNADRVLVVISDAIRFPEHSSLDPVNVPLNAAWQSYLLRLAMPEVGEFFNAAVPGRRGRYVRLARPLDDQMTSLLKPLQPHVFDITQPKVFQKALATLSADLRKK